MKDYTKMTKEALDKEFSDRCGMNPRKSRKAKIEILQRQDENELILKNIENHIKGSGRKFTPEN